mmetsp:Transcript_16492/g.46015  ORF Transcript_16492/g.46015 Transcript_16492/m.46015 type:complete len:110 (-) Transcript_16492:179-508(-)
MSTIYKVRSGGGSSPSPEDHKGCQWVSASGGRSGRGALLSPLPLEEAGRGPAGVLAALPKLSAHTSRVQWVRETLLSGCNNPQAGSMSLPVFHERNAMAVPSRKEDTTE